jgi:uncharacterized protein YbaR (Trm112 family)
MTKQKAPKPTRPSIICSRCNKSFPFLIVDDKGMLICRECMKHKPFVDSISELIYNESKVLK